MKRISCFLMALVILCSLFAVTVSADDAKAPVEHLVIGTTTANNTFNLYSQADIFGRINYVGFCRGNWIYEAEDGSLQPYFLTSFEISEDGTTLDFTFPTTAVWSDGMPVTWDDVEFSFRFLRDTAKNTGLIHLTDIEQTGEGSGRLVFSAPDVYAYLVGTAMMQGVLPKHVWEKFEGTDDYGSYTEPEAAVGCGPYKLVSYDVDAQVSYYEAIPENNYHGDITVKSVTIKTYPDQTAVMMALNQGEIDCYYAYSSPIDSTLIDLIMDDAIDPGKSIYSGEDQITFGMTRPAGMDYNFRLAVTKAMDWKLLANVTGGDYAEIPCGGIIPPSCNGYLDGLPRFAQDIDEANRILDEAGYADINGDGIREFPDGTEMNILIVPQYSKKMDLRNRIAEVLINNLAAVGIKAYVDQSIIVSSEVWESNIMEGNYDIAIGYTTAGMARHSSAFRYYVWSPKPGTERSASWLWGTYQDEEFNATVWRMLNAFSSEEYVECIQWLQQEASDTLFGAALSWTYCFYPYRTDKYGGWYNRASWGVVNDELWYTLYTK
ncbi:MAG: ABC transporter substrate-binding protein [Firmicutes bacterium]|nr:ABC transporter substrate-binding protein [Bacillota bacterium]MDY6159844.1 ABC transporter substrate-binding protein [Candidatus Faecousia sp.]